MLRRTGLLSSLVLLVLMVSVVSAQKRKPTVIQSQSFELRQLRENQGLMTGDTCAPADFDSIAYWIDEWVIGDELYKIYTDPSLHCTSPYPFTISEVHLAMHFGGPTTIVYSGDIEDVDNSEPGCPYPGPNMLAISSSYESSVPEEGLYDVWVPLDPPIVVNGPFFAGFYIGPGLDPNSAPAVCCDATPVICHSYNIWDESTGFIDLCSNEYWVANGQDWHFPGRLAMWVVGYTGGSGSGTGPEVKLVSPTAGNTLMGSVNLWASASSESTPIDYMVFEYSSGGGKLHRDRA